VYWMMGEGASTPGHGKMREARKIICREPERRWFRKPICVAKNLSFLTTD
jgi:hypothetical protein